MFHPGVTAVHAFTIPFNKDTISKLIISYWQDDHIILERVLTSTDPNFENAFVPMQDWTDTQKKHHSKFFIQFTQDESLLFSDNLDTSIQINVLTTAGSRHSSRMIRKRDVKTQLHREVISNGE